jgi:hypothetical protein
VVRPGPARRREPEAQGTNTNRNVDPNNLSDAEIVAIIEAGRGDSPAPKPNGGSGELMAAQPIRTARQLV